MAWREFFLVALLLHSPFGQSIHAQCDFASLEQKIQAGGTIQLNCTGPIVFPHEIVVRTDVTLAGGILSGNMVTRLFRVEQGAFLQLRDLTIQDGAVAALPNPRTNTAATPFDAELDGTNVYGGAILNLGGTLTLSNCAFFNNSIRGGDGGPNAALTGFAGKGGDGFGGAIMSSNGMLKIEACSFQDNRSLSGDGGVDFIGTYPGAPGHSSGGAIYHQGGELQIANSAFAMNQVIAGKFGTGTKGYSGLSKLLGGAVAIEGSKALISNCRFLTNSASRASADGGAVYANFSTNLVIANSEFDHNSAIGGVEDWGPALGMGGARGGAIFLTNSVARIDSVFCSGNAAQGGTIANARVATSGPFDCYGGAIFCAGYISIQKSSFFGNVCIGAQGYSPDTGSGSARGGAVYNASLLLFENCTFYLNTASAGILIPRSGSPPQSVTVFQVREGAGGGFANSGTSSVTHCTFSANNAESFLTNARLSSAISGSITNSGTLTLARSILAHSPSDNYGGTVIDAGDNLSSDATPPFSKTKSRNFVDPLLGPFRFYRGRTPTLPLLPGSPAIDAAVSSALYPTDQRGQPRPFGSQADIGAYEVTAAPTTNVLEIMAESRGAAVSVFAQPSLTYVISASSNLLQWAPVSTNTIDALGRATISVHDSPGSRLFFQATPQ